MDQASERRRRRLTKGAVLLQGRKQPQSEVMLKHDNSAGKPPSHHVLSGCAILKETTDRYWPKTRFLLSKACQHKTTES